MVFKRELSSSFPREYDRWESEGASWVVQDLPPEDNEKVVELLVNHLCPDEVLCSSSGLNDSPTSVKGISDFWRQCLSQHTTLACYKEVDGVRSLVGANVCVVAEKGKHDTFKIEGEEWQTVYDGLGFVEAKRDPFEYLGLDVLLTGLGLVVRRDCRGAKLGSRILNAREPLCEYLGLTATSTVFTGISSQKSALRCGFTSIAEASLSEMAEAGLKYPKDDHRLIKLMVKRFK